MWVLFDSSKSWLRYWVVTELSSCVMMLIFSFCFFLLNNNKIGESVWRHFGGGWKQADNSTWQLVFPNGVLTIWQCGEVATLAANGKQDSILNRNGVAGNLLKIVLCIDGMARADVVLHQWKFTVSAIVFFVLLSWNCSSGGTCYGEISRSLVETAICPCVQIPRL